MPTRSARVRVRFPWDPGSARQGRRPADAVVDAVSAGQAVQVRRQHLLGAGIGWLGRDGSSAPNSCPATARR